MFSDSLQSLRGYGRAMGKEKQMYFLRQTLAVFQPCELFHFVEKESDGDDLVLPSLMKNEVLNSVTMPAGRCL